jgi:molybdenum cofactor cytidylyltransferase
MILPAATVIVLAAGLGSRFGGNGSRLAQDLDGRGDAGAAFDVTLRNALASGLSVLVVTTADLAPLAAEQVAEHDVLVVPAPAPIRGRGVGDAIAAGVLARANSSGWLVLPADMPRVRPTTLLQVADALQTHAVAYAQHRGRRGRPVAFAAEMYSELAGLTGDEGARRLVARYPACAVEVDDPGVLNDIDIVQDLADLRAARGGSAAAEPMHPQG